MRPVLFIAALSLAYGLCGAEPEPPAKAAEGERIKGNDPTVLVVYFSRSGNTRRAAHIIRTAVGGDLAELLAKEPYPQSYGATTVRVKQELEHKIRSPLASDVTDLKPYRTIFIGSPVWYGTIAPPVATFLSSHDFRGKLIIPFFTHGGGGSGTAAKDMRVLLPQVIVQRPIVCRGSRVNAHKAELTQRAKMLLPRR